MGDCTDSGVADGDAVGVSVGSGEGDGLVVGESVATVVLVGDGIAVPLGAASGMDSATQATRESVRPVKSNALVIAAFACHRGRIG